MWARGVIAIFAVMAACFAYLPDSAQAEDRDWTSDFYSYLPAAPDIKTPDLDFLPFWTDDLKKAKRAYKDGNFDKARKYFERASDDNNIVADWYLGHMYRLGRGVPRDDAKAFSYYGRVADAFDSEESDQNRLKIMVDALVRVADYYRTGSKVAGVPQNFERASRIYRLAATYGHPASQYALGLMAIGGQGMREQPEQGLRWLLAAAKKRYAPAEAALGDLYWKGQIVQRDRTRAIMWYLLARSSTRPGDQPEIYDRLDKMLAETTEAERLEAEARATVWADQYPADDEANQQPE